MNTQRFSHVLTNFLFAMTFILVAGGILLVSTRPTTASGTSKTKFITANTTAQTTEKILVSISNDTSSWNDDTLYTLNPDGSNKTPLFDMHSQPKFNTGEIFAPRISADGRYIYFYSEHADIYTPARRNIFRIASLNNSLEQMTPGPNSGIWGQTGSSTVSGQVEYGNGSPCINCSVYLEGMDMVTTGASGGFSFQNVPAGVRWLLAYRPALDAFDAQTVNIVSGLNNTGITLVPNSTVRMNFEYPAIFGSRIYYSFNNEIQWTDADFTPPQTIYKSPADACTGIPTVDAFDVGAATGKIAIYDYQEGCGIGNNNHNGVYTTNKDGSNKQLLLNMLADSNWNNPTLPVQVYWSPNENYLAVKASYDWFDYLLVYDTSGALKGFAYADTTSEVLTLYGWSPDGAWLLYSQYDGNPAQATLGKIGVNTDGSLDNTSIVTLLTNQPVSGATWGQLAVTQKVYLPLIST